MAVPVASRYTIFIKIGNKTITDYEIKADSTFYLICTSTGLSFRFPTYSGEETFQTDVVWTYSGNETFAGFNGVFDENDFVLNVGQERACIATHDSTVSLTTIETQSSNTHKIEVTYNGNTIKTLDEAGTFTLPCANKLMASDVVIATNGLDGETLEVTYNGNSIINTTTDGTHTLSCANKVMASDIGVSVQTVTPIIGTLEETDWNTIRQVSDAGTASQYWSVGDSKTVTLNGTIGTLTVSNLQLKVYILGFDHNIAVESGGSYSHSITFGFALSSNNANVALCDSNYGFASKSGSKWFNMNHSANVNSGGWKGCDMRYDILGSVEVKNQQNATSAAISSPVANTLMAALPSDLRAVLKPITKYTDNVGGGTNTAANVTTTVDYLPLLAEKEIFGYINYANSAETSQQVRYAYFASVGSKKKYQHLYTSSAASWWARSVRSVSISGFCLVNTSGLSDYYNAQYSYGVAPIFAV